MKNRRIESTKVQTVAQWGFILIAFGACLVFLSWANYRFAESTPGGNDFLARWMGARFVWQGIQPYDPRVALETQIWTYGRAADPGRGEDLARFAYPLYSMLFFGPFGLFDFTTARALWMTLLEIGTAAFAVLSAAIAGWESQRGKTVLWILYALLGYFGIRAIVNGNPIVLVGVLIAAAAFLLGKGHLLQAGIVLALATIKPQIAVFPVLWTILWCLFRKRYSLIVSFGVSLTALVGIGMLFVPDWIVLNLREILAYPGYTQPGNPAAAFGLWFGDAGKVSGWALSLAALAALVWLWIRYRRGTYRDYLFLLSVSISAAPLLGIPFDPGNEYLLLLPTALCLSAWKSATRRNNFFWSVAVGGLFVGLWALFLLTVNAGPQPVQSPVMLFPLPILLIAGFAFLARGHRLTCSA
jgi:hypothetical protein